MAMFAGQKLTHNIVQFVVEDTWPFERAQVGKTAD